MSVSHPSPALLIVDMLSRFDFPDAARIVPAACRAVPAIARLRTHFHTRRWPVIYANDNFANWQMDFRQLVDACLATPGPSARIAQALLPTAHDYFVLKPKHSAFLATPLAVLLAKLGSRQLVVSGMTADSCIAATCMDSNAREYDTVVVREAVAAIGDRKARALRLLHESNAARVVGLSTYLRQ